jgi:hypothetical protein
MPDEPAPAPFDYDVYLSDDDLKAAGIDVDFDAPEVIHRKLDAFLRAKGLVLGARLLRACSPTSRPPRLSEPDE